MSIDSLFALFGAMIILAIVPGPAVFAIIARSFSSGKLQAFYMTVGIVLGDYIFIVLALFGLSALAEVMGTAFFIIKYLSAAYLIWLGVQLLRTKAKSIDIETSKDSSLISNLLTGLFITLGNPKAIIFYVGFFPAFINVNEVTFYDTSLIMLAATLAFGSVNMCYSLLAVKAKNTFKSPNATTVINKTAGTIMVSTGALVAIKT
ncbi:LysE family translocator [Colwellia sp. 6M3]|jgi:threonine/homoserine/homoserine lactone efflux protein|uniref:LysE family translocator n=1 Tax=Colwellia sp. 6M3 TaxID=2759849 RepID=UPI0015F50F90|nr:LysE family translocator [Colwellia sp. 6M3]MBA6417999.1 LysE family translocator [Colwellia sp. 6M3]